MSDSAIFVPSFDARLRTSLAEWWRTDGLTWVYVFKAVAAALLALAIALRLELPQPPAAMSTVFIVMQPQSGAVLAKSFYRICGTIAGLAVALVLVALFAQQREIFLAAFALWTGVCTAGAAYNRNFRSYGFLLAGYTAGIVGIPAAMHPDGAFVAALTRGTEIALGVLCAGLVSALVLPRYATEEMDTSVRQRFSKFVEQVAAALGSRVAPAEIEHTNAQILEEVVSFESMRSLALFEGHAPRARSERLAQLNSEFMTASTRFQALHRLLDRLRDAGAHETVAKIKPFCAELGPLLYPPAAPILTIADATASAQKLQAFKAALPRRVREVRAGLAERPESESALLDFDTATELLYRFVDDMRAYALTYASLATAPHEGERAEHHYEPRTTATTALVAGLRGTVLLVALSTLWIASEWPSGATLVSNAVTICALASATPRPARTASQLAIGTGLGALVGFFFMFYVYPYIDGLPMLCFALAPMLALGVFIGTRSGLAGIGAGYGTYLPVLAGPENHIHYDPANYIGMAFALTLSPAAVAVACAVFLPRSTRWLIRRLLADLRRQVALACRSPLDSARPRFESRARDIAYQAYTAAESSPRMRQQTLAWLVIVQEVGHAVIDLRTELADLPRNTRYAARSRWRRRISLAEGRICTLFARPGNAGFDAALAACLDAMAATRTMLAEFDAPRDERHRLQRILSHLHFVRTALIDPRGPLAQFASGPRGGKPAASSSGASHAS